jgi:hypothetical protein
MGRVDEDGLLLATPSGLVWSVGWQRPGDEGSRREWAVKKSGVDEVLTTRIRLQHHLLRWGIALGDSFLVVILMHVMNVVYRDSCNSSQ